MDNLQPFTRDFKQRPEQFISKMNQTARKLNAGNGAQVTFNKQGTEAIVIGQQPQLKGDKLEFGIRKYKVSGDVITLDSVIL